MIIASRILTRQRKLGVVSTILACMLKSLLSSLRPHVKLSHEFFFTHDTVTTFCEIRWTIFYYLLAIGKLIINSLHLSRLSLSHPTSLSFDIKAPIPQKRCKTSFLWI